MERIHPIHEENCRAHYGKTVLVILQDGTELAGVMTKVENGKLYLNGGTADVETKSTRRKRSTVRKATTRSSQTAKVTDVPVGPGLPFGFGPGPGIVLDLSLLALLFVLL